MILLSTSPAHAALMAALHRHAFRKPWTETDFAGLSAAPGVQGQLAVDPAPEGLGLPLPVGFVLCRSAADEAEILTLAVLPPYRDRGIGRRLVVAAAHALAGGGARALFLEVATENASARALYERIGFEVVGRRANYYDPGVAASRDALMLRAALPLPPGLLAATGANRAKTPSL